VLVMNGDSYCDGDLPALLAHHRAQQASATLLLTRVEDAGRYGSVLVDERGKLSAFREKNAEAGPGLINAGVYLLGREVLASIPEREWSLERQVFPSWMGRGLYGFEGGGRFLDIGTPDSYQQASTFVTELSSPSPSPSLRPSSGAPMRPCRICKGSDLVGFLDLGLQPHCNSFLKPDDPKQQEPRWPLDLLYCRDCHLVQLSAVVDAEQMFRHYLYVSGTTRTLTQHFKESAQAVIDRFRPAPSSLVVDIGSNDGTFLQCFKDLGLRAVGVDPASNIAAQANARGVETVNDFFTEAVARRIREQHGPASLITAAGVFFHIDDMDDVCRGIHALLADDGVLHVQAIYLGAMLEQTSYDNVYHEHVSYYTLHPLIRLFGRFGLEVFDVGFSAIHGGSLMLYVCKTGARPTEASVERQLSYERAQQWDTLAPYQAFASRVRQNRRRLLSMLREMKASGKRLAAYTAPAKGNTLLNYCGIGPDLLEYACERAPLKVGLLTPGMHIPVIDEAEAMADPPDCFLMLAWNFKDEFLHKNKLFLDKGGQFLIPIPEPHLVGRTPA
jgi:hypothetical protein